MMDSPSITSKKIKIELKPPNEAYVFKDPKVSDLYDKSQKMLYYVRDSHDGKKYPKKKYLEKEEEFNDLVDTLVKHKLTLKNIRNILQDTKFDSDNFCNLSQIILNPFNFLNEDKQLLTFVQVMFIVDKKIKEWGGLERYFHAVLDVKNKIMYAWIYYCFLKKIGQYYIPKYRIDKELSDFDWKKYDINVSEIQSLFVKIKHNNTIYYSMKKFIDLEKETGDKLIEHFYEDHELCLDECTELAPHLTCDQRQAVLKAIQYKFSLITGYPGTGKSTIIKEIVDYHNERGDYVWLLAPTGKAIKDLKIKCNKTEDKFAGTIHRFLYIIYPEWMAYRNKKNQRYKTHAVRGHDASQGENREEVYEYMDNKYENPFAVFVIDESSMIPFDLFTKLINIFIKHDTKLVLVGDNNQLPPIQVGRPFECILKSDIEFPTTCLEEIKRTDKVILAQNIKKYINGGLVIDDFDNNEIVFKELNDMSEGNLEKEMRMLFDENGDYRVITPQHGFEGGTEQCNRILQHIHNPEQKLVLEHFKTNYYLNDIIIQTENDYSLDPPRVNGDVAKIIDRETSLIGGKTKKFCVIEYQDDKQQRRISVQDLKDDFQLFYSATVHKFQGSQERVCVIVLSKSHTMWNGENNHKLFYTAISRAQEKCVIIGCKRVLHTLLMSKGGRDTFYSKFMREFNEYE